MTDKRGFTLIELLVTTSMLVLLSGAAFAVFTAGTRSAAKVKRCGRMMAHGQAALQAMTRDIRAAVQHGTFLLTALDAQYEGLDSDTIDFIAARFNPRQGSENVTGRSEIGYYIDNDPDTEARWLLRRQDERLDRDPLGGGVATLAGSFVSELNLEFYDGLDWEAGWEDEEEFPHAVRIEIVVVDEDEIESPMCFSTVVSIMVR